MICNSCGTSMPDGAKFCRSCGAPLAAAVPEPEEPLVQPEQTMYAGSAEFESPEIDLGVPVSQPAQGYSTQYAYGDQQPEQQMYQDYRQPVQSEQPVYQNYQQPEQNYYNNGYDPYAQPAPAVPAAPAAVKGSDVSGRALIWLVVLYLLCSLLFISVLARFLTNKSYLKGVFKDVSEQAAKSDAVVDMIEKNSSLKRSEIEDIIEKTDFSSLLSKYSAEFTSFAFEGGKTPKLDADEIIDAIEDNENDIERAIGKKLNLNDWQNIRREVNDFCDEFNSNVKDVKRDQGAVFSTSSFIGSVYFMYGLLAAMLLVLVRLIFLYKKDGSGVYRGFRGYAVVYGIHAAFSIGLALIVPAVLSSIKGDAAGIAAAVINPMMKAPIYVGVIFASLCVLFIVLAVVLHISYNKKHTAAS